MKYEIAKAEYNMRRSFRWRFGRSSAFRQISASWPSRKAAGIVVALL